MDMFLPGADLTESESLETINIVKYQACRKLFYHLRKGVILIFFPPGRLRAQGRVARVAKGVGETGQRASTALAESRADIVS